MRAQLTVWVEAQVKRSRILADMSVLVVQGKCVRLLEIELPCSRKVRACEYMSATEHDMLCCPKQNPYVGTG